MQSHREKVARGEGGLPMVDISENSEKSVSIWRNFTGISEDWLPTVQSPVLQPFISITQTG
jgi:hypothetical protein